MDLFPKKCEKCGSTDHKTSECPHQMFSTKCERCGSTEHSTSNCPHAMFTTKCEKCGSTDHKTSECPHPMFSTKCERCGSTEHPTNKCPHPMFSTKCDICGSNNHATSQCPQGLFKTQRTPNRTATSSSSSDDDGGSVLGWLLGVGVVIFIAIWLLKNLVLPIALLNSALVFAILASVMKSRNSLYAVLGILGGCYMLLDILNGWTSANFINHVVKNHNWLTVFVYINSLAVGVCVWFLVKQYWTEKKQDRPAEGRQTIKLTAPAIAIITLSTIVFPILYHSMPNPFTLGPDEISKAEYDRLTKADEGPAYTPPQYVPPVQNNQAPVNTSSDIEEESAESVDANTPGSKYKKHVDFSLNVDCFELSLREGWAVFPMGGKISIKTPDGKIIYEEPGNTQSYGPHSEGKYTICKIEENTTGFDVVNYWTDDGFPATILVNKKSTYKLKDFPKSGEETGSLNNPVKVWLDPNKSTIRLSMRAIYVNAQDRNIIFFDTAHDGEINANHKLWQTFPLGNYYISPYGNQNITVKWWQGY